MRDLENFNRAWSKLEWMILNHKRAYWLYATAGGYEVSIVAPCPSEIPWGTMARLYDDPTGRYLKYSDLRSIDYIKSSRTQPSAADGVFVG